jgi:hypothetical protein
VTWSATAGSVTSAGVFTHSGTGTVTVKATSTQDPTKSGSADVVVSAPPPPPLSVSAVAVSCLATAVELAQATKCSAQVTGTGSFSSEVNWSANAGTIDRNGAYAAPLVARNVTVTATSVQDTTKSGTAAITVVATPANNKPFWWDSWPRVMWDSQANGTSATNSDVLGAHAETGDEGVGPYYRINRVANYGPLGSTDKPRRGRPSIRLD